MVSNPAVPSGSKPQQRQRAALQTRTGFFWGGFVFARKTNGLCDQRVFEMKRKQRLRSRRRRKANCVFYVYILYIFWRRLRGAGEELARLSSDLSSRWDVKSLSDGGGENHLDLCSCDEAEEDFKNKIPSGLQAHLFLFSSVFRVLFCSETVAGDC